jgi:hypothetical protein
VKGAASGGVKAVAAGFGAPGIRHRVWIAFNRKNLSYKTDIPECVMGM